MKGEGSCNFYATIGFRRVCGILNLNVMLRCASVTGSAGLFSNLNQGIPATRSQRPIAQRTLAPAKKIESVERESFCRS